MTPSSILLAASEATGEVESVVIHVCSRAIAVSPPHVACLPCVVASSNVRMFEVLVDRVSTLPDHRSRGPWFKGCQIDHLCFYQLNVYLW